MSDRLAAAVAELVAALRDELTTDAPDPDAPERLLSVTEAARALGIGRSLLYAQMADGRIRSVKVGGRRLVPSGALREVVR